MVGKGSNLLVADAGFAGLAVVLGEAFATVDVVDGTPRCPGRRAPPACRSWPAAARRPGSPASSGRSGVPGSIGGAVRMNAGGHGSDMAATLVRVRVVDLATGEDGSVPAAALDLGYRRSSIGRVAGRGRGRAAPRAPGDRAPAEAEIAEIVRWRRANQPGGHNAGSVFTNPPGDSAGRLIDAAGCKGLRVGTAEVSTKHANFIQADDGGPRRRRARPDGRGRRAGCDEHSGVDCAPRPGWSASPPMTPVGPASRGPSVPAS